MFIQPLHLLLTAMTSWLTREQAELIAYLKEGSRVLRAHTAGKRIRFTDMERRRLAVKAKALGRRRLREICPIVTPDTLLRWHRQLVARKYDGTGTRRVGRPHVREETKGLVVRMARDNSTWGYTRIQGALSNLGYKVGRTTDALSGFLKGVKYIILDRDSRYTKKFRKIIRESGVDVIRLPRRSPNLNAYAERFVRSIKEECLGRMIFFSEQQLRVAVDEYMKHYHVERNHQGLGNELIDGGPQPCDCAGEVVCEPRFGGMLNHYRRAA